MLQSHKISNFSYTCCCPCIILGNIRTATSREKVSYTCNMMNMSLGSSGLHVCLHSCISCFLCWPISPILGYNIHVQREKIKIIYSTEPTTSGIYDISKCCSTIFSWPCALQENYVYLLSKYDEGLLRFDWEENILDDLLRARPKQRDRLVAIIGPKHVGKSTLFKKILFYTDSTQNNQHINSKTSVGIKPYKFSEEYVDFLELWDIATDEVDSKANRHLISTAQNIIIMYDSSDISGDSLTYAKLMYESIVASIRPGCVIWFVANKLDLVHDETRLVEGEKWAVDKNVVFQKISSLHFIPKQDIF